MRTQPSSRVPIVGLALLKFASLLVPACSRREWSAEWRSEVWYVHQSRLEGTCTDLDTILFCLGAFQDAFWLRTNLHPESKRSPLLESPQECASFLALVAVASLTVMFLLPGTRQAVFAHPVPSPKGLALISHAGAIDTSSPAMPIEDYTAWKSRPLRHFSDFAFYKPLQTIIRTSRYGAQNLSVALSSENLPNLLHAPVSSSAMDVAHAGHKAALALSFTAWSKYFDSDPQLIGKYVTVGQEQAVVAAILPEDSWRLTGRPDAWLLKDDASLALLPSDSKGLIIGQIANVAQRTKMQGRWQFSLQKDDGYESFDCAPLAVKVYQPWLTFLFTLFLACAALPATTPLPLGDYPASKHPLFAAMRWRRWLFLLAKVGLAVLIVYCVSTTLAYADTSFTPNSAVYIQFTTSFVGLLFSFRWALRDQRRRCPVCLRTLTHPVRVGQPSRNFLAWHGTEFMCEKGHGLLHIPEMATSWFSTQRWLSLDPSWKGLFPETYLPSAGLF
jgi:hypothetical protein